SSPEFINTRVTRIPFSYQHRVTGPVRKFLQGDSLILRWVRDKGAVLNSHVQPFVSLKAVSNYFGSFFRVADRIKKIQRSDITRIAPDRALGITARLENP